MHNLLLMNKKVSTAVHLASENYGSWLDLHSALIEARLSSGLSQRELGEKLGISQPAVAQFESLGVNPRIATLLAYAQALEVKLQFSL